MPFRKTRFIHLIINLVWLAFCSRVGAQPYRWEVTDPAGKLKFTVTADTIYSVLENVYNLRIGKENILIEGDPFHPLFRSAQEQFLPLTARYFGAFDDTGVRLHAKSDPGKALFYKFRKTLLWQGEVLGQTDLKWIFSPGGPEEILADSLRIEGERLLMFRDDGIVEIDRKLRTRFFKTSGKIRALNPFSTYCREDSLWNPTSGSNQILKWHPSGFWWNDTTYLDSGSAGVFMQTPTRPRFRIGDSVGVVSKNFCLLKQKGKFSLLGAGGKRTSVSFPTVIATVHDTLCGLRIKGKWILVGPSGNKYNVNKSVSNLGEMQEGMIMAKAGKRFGFIDPTGFIRISCRYDSILPFHRGLSAARFGKVWGYLDKDERIRIQPHYEVAGSFSESIAPVKKDGKWGLINLSGDFVQVCGFDSVAKGRCIGWKTMRSFWKGWLNNEGKILLPNRYSDIIEPCSGYLQVFRDGKTGLFSSEGLPVFPINYQRILAEPKTLTLFAR